MYNLCNGGNCITTGIRWLILITGALETVIFTGNIFGWAALNYMLKQQGVYRHLCPLSNHSSDNNSTVSKLCLCSIKRAVARSVTMSCYCRSVALITIVRE